MSTIRLRVDHGRPLPRPIQVGLVAVLLAVAGACWVPTVAGMSGMRGPGGMSGMNGPGSSAGPEAGLGGLGWFSLTWAAMMAAMMLPSLAPMVLTYARVQQAQRSGTDRLPVGGSFLFVAGYLVSWTAVGVVGYPIVAGVRSLDVGSLAWNEAGRYIAGGVIVVAALYQLTGLKGSCLRRCRSPQMPVRHWRSGPRGALRMGVEHGGYCIGSTGPLMMVLFVLGWMSLGWMAFVTALVALEKLLPWKALANRGVAVLLAVLGLAVVFAPAYVPGPVPPGPAMAGVLPIADLVVTEVK